MNIPDCIIAPFSAKLEKTDYWQAELIELSVLLNLRHLDFRYNRTGRQKVKGDLKELTLKKRSWELLRISKKKFMSLNIAYQFFKCPRSNCAVEVIS